MEQVLVSIGVDQTGGGLPKLRAAAKGAEQVAEWGRTQGFEVHELTDKNGPVRSFQIFDILQEVVLRGTCAKLVIYFAGHGLLQSAQAETWLLSGAPTNINEAINVAGSIDFARCTGIPHVVFVSDACRSISPSRELDAVNGSQIFPSQPPRAPMPEVDVFYATIPGSVANEVPPDEAVPHYRGIFTECLLDALHGKVDQVIETINDGMTVKRIVPSRPLKHYLLERVPEAVSDISLSLQQDPEIRVESAPPLYLGEIVQQPPEVTRGGTEAETLSHGGTYGSDSLSYGLEDSKTLSPAEKRTRALGNMKRRHFNQDGTEAPSAAEQDAMVVAMEREVDALLAAKGRISFETHTGFTVHGAKVTQALGAGLNIEIFEEDGVSQVRIHISGNGRQPESQSALLIFDSGTAGCLAVFPGFIGTVVVGEHGRIETVNYTPARGTPLYDFYKDRAEEVERRRAYAAVAAANGVFSVNREDAKHFAQYLRLGKRVDPTLGLYAAYAFVQAGYHQGAASVFDYMQESGLVCFDIAMLAYRYEGFPANMKVTPSLPMLAQGWALLGKVADSLPEVVLEARRFTIPALWTTFRKEGVAILADAVNEGVI